MITQLPSTVDEASRVIAQATAEKQRLTFIGGGTQLDLGNAIATDVALRTERLSKIVEYAPSDMVIIAEAGVTLAQLQSTVRAERQMLALDAPNADRATIGGLVATGAYGPRRAKYGAIRDLIIGVTLVRADGVIAKGGGKVVKNVAGFDLPKMACGSLGTLGLIATATFRLHPLPEMTSTVMFPGLTADRVFATVKRVRDAQLEPSSAVAMRTANGAYDLAFRCEGFGKGVREQIARLLAFGGASELNDDEAAAFWKQHDQARTAGALRVRVASLPSHFAEVHGVLSPLFGDFAWYATLGLGFYAGSATDVEAVAHALRAARETLARSGGTLVVEAAPAAVRDRVDVWGPVSSSFRVMEELKQRFDPDRRLNPGRFVGGL